MLLSKSVSALRLGTNLIRGSGRVSGSMVTRSSSGHHQPHYTPTNYEKEFRDSIEKPEEYWAEIAEDVVWTKKWDKVLSVPNSPFAKWFAGGRLSMCYNAVDRHVNEGRGGQRAIVWDSPISGGHKSELTYSQLQDKVAKLAGMLSKMGVGKGDRVLIYMPMVPEAVEAMLATVRLGAVHSVVFGGFAAHELAVRIKHTQPKVIMTANFGIEPKRLIQYKPIVDEALMLSNAPDTPCVVFKRADLPTGMGSHPAASEAMPKLEDQLKSGKDVVWQEAVAASQPHDCVDVDANDPLYILYTSGTTGMPKGVQHPTGGHAVVNRWSMKALYGLDPGDTWWAASDLGWIVGHEYICYSPLLAGNTTVLYEGKPVGTPDAGQFFRVIHENNVKALFVAPTALRAIKMADPHAAMGKKYDISSLHYLYVAGEHCDHATRIWSEHHFGVPTLDNWWQTETAHAITATCVGLGNKLHPPKDTCGMPVPGFNIKILKPDGSQAARGELGRIVAKLPMPPGTMSTLYKSDERFIESYFIDYPGYYDTSDAGIMTEEGYICVMARDDDIINVAGHRLSTKAIEEVILKHKDVADVAVVGFHDQLKGHLPFALYVKTPEADPKADITQDLIKMVQNDIGHVAAFKMSVQVPDLPRTRSGKLPRKSIAQLVSGGDYKIPPTCENPDAYDDILDVLTDAGIV